MAITVTVETGAGIANANSFASILTIDAYVLTNPHDSTWTALTDAQKNGYAVWSCRVLNEQILWDGWIVDSDQALPLPRSGMVDREGYTIDNNVIPDEVVNAQCELARLLAVEDRTADNGLLGFKEISVGSIKLVADKADRPIVLAPSVFNMIKHLGTKSVSKGTSQTVRV